MTNILKCLAVPVITLLYVVQVVGAQPKGYTPRLETCPCAVQADSSVKTRCAYLIVPENRQKPTGKSIKLPFILVESNNPAKKKDPVLFTGGGPGSSSLGMVRGIHRRNLIKNRDFIAFEQRGTRYALPCLECPEIDANIKNGYRFNRAQDSSIIEGVKSCRKRLLAEGIDLSAYNTAESVADIEDLRLALKIDSLNLLGISYSGGLMMAVLQQHASHIRSVILDSALPEFVNIDEEEIGNFMEALDQVFHNCADTLSKEPYGNLKEKFQRYFNSIGGKSFTISYLEKGTTDSVKIAYSRNELLKIIQNRIEDFSSIKTIPGVIIELINGNHAVYIRDLLDGIFRGHNGPSGMRMSVYCSDKMAYAREEIIHQQYKIHPYLTGYYVNDVYQPMCKCWTVKSIPADVKKPFYANTPALLGAGGMDDACRPVYNDLIHHYLPNSQRLLFVNRPHAPLLNSREGDQFIGQFLDHPFQKVQSTDKAITAY
jgi:pimeloyl-ACP methyl ester carboxylesterase